MKSWARKVKFRKIRSRFLAAMIALTLPSIMLLGYVSYNIASDTLMDVNEQTNRDQLRTSSEVADLLFRNINNLHFAIVVNDEIREDLKNIGEDREVLPDHSNVRTSTRLQQLVSESFNDTRYVQSICLFDLEFETSCFGRSDDAGKYETETKSEAIQASDWYRDAYASNGRVVYYPTDVFGETNRAFSTVKLFRDAVSGEPIGMLIVNVHKTIFGKVFVGSTFGSDMVIAGTASGSPVTVYSNADAAVTVEGTMNEAIGSLREQGYLASTLTNQSTGWRFVRLVKTKDLLEQSDDIRWATTAIAAGFGAVALLLSYFVSGTVTKPLLQLKKMMLDWTMGSRQFPEAFERDEVGVIGETFKRMAVENEELSARLVRSELNEREAELRALQSQIKPHFLYNTLDSIYWMATLKKHDEVAQMAVSLSESFKLSLNKGRELIPVYKELLHIEHYMKIQNIRFGGRFRYVQEVDESIMGMEMLKLLLQPLVENAIYHGLEPKMSEGEVRLTGARDGAYLVFTVEDDGVGMDDIARTEQGYGLRNVKERLSLYYGEDSMTEVWSRPAEGTRITLRFRPSSILKNTDIDPNNEALT